MDKYSKQFKLTAITAFLEGSKGFRLVAARFGMDVALLRRWVAAYRLHGEASLRGRRSDGTHTAHFKLSVLQRMWVERLSLRQTAALFNLGSASQVGIWQQQYYSGGIKALSPRPRGVPTPMPTSTTAPALPRVKDEDLSHAELLAKLRKAQLEIIWLKKLKEDREKQKRQAASARKKPG
jgi:transposase